MQLLSDDPEDAIQSKREITIFDFEEANPDGGRHGVSEIETGVSFQLCESDRAYLHGGSFIVASYCQEEERN